MLSTYLRHVVPATLMKEEYWSSVAWKEIAKSVTQTDLDLAHSKASIAKERLSTLGMCSERKPKTIKRVKEKILERTESGDYFKVVSDLLAFRVNCSVTEIDEKLALIEKLENCVSYVRKSGNKVCSYKNGTVYVDIVQYVYLYFEDIGFVTELQIGHPFATYSFEVYSSIREGGSQVDLWTDGFYVQVRDYILSATNKTIPSCTKEEILEKASSIHSGVIPERLLSIIDAI